MARCFERIAQLGNSNHWWFSSGPRSGRNEISCKKERRKKAQKEKKRGGGGVALSGLSHRRQLEKIINDSNFYTKTRDTCSISAISTLSSPFLLLSLITFLQILKFQTFEIRDQAKMNLGNVQRASKGDIQTEYIELEWLDCPNLRSRVCSKMSLGDFGHFFWIFKF